MFVGPRRAVRSLATAAAVFALLLSGAGSANAYVFWANSGTNTVGRANLDGSSPSASFISPTTSASYIAFDGTYIYWADQGAGTIGRARADGTGTPDQAFVNGVGSPTGVAVDGSYVYWGNAVGVGSSTIGRAALTNPGSPDLSFIQNIDPPEGLAVDASFVYWGSNGVTGSIGRAALSSPGSPNINFIPNDGVSVQTPHGIAVSGSNIYWADYDLNLIGSAAINGSGPAAIVAAGGGHPQGIAIDGSHIYWSDEGVFGMGAEMRRSNLDGTGMTPNFVAGTSGPFGVAVGLLTQSITFPALPNTALTATPPSPAATASSGLPVTYSSATAAVCGVSGAGAISFVTVGTCTINANQVGDADWAPAAQQQQSFQVTASGLKTPTPKSSCVIAPAATKGAIPRRGTKRLLKPGCVTNAGQRIGVSAAGRLRGDIRLYELFCAGTKNQRTVPTGYGDGSRYCRKGALSIRTFGNRMRLRLTWYATATDSYSAYRLTRNYTT